MIQFNLLPDVKIQYLRAQYRKRVIMLVSAVVSAVFLVIFALLYVFVRINQPAHIANLDKDINSQVAELQAVPDLDRILTIQNQLNALPGLHDQKVFSSRFFDYLVQLTPQAATITNADVDLEAFTISLKGEADNLLTVNKFVDTLKFTDYRTSTDEKQEKAFSAVVLQSFSVGTTGQSKVSYEINFSYNPVIFANSSVEGQPTASNVVLIVPRTVTTRSETQKPEGLFQPPPTPPQGPDPISGEDE